MVQHVEQQALLVGEVERADLALGAVRRRPGRRPPARTSARGSAAGPRAAWGAAAAGKQLRRSAASAAPALSQARHPRACSTRPKSSVPAARSLRRALEQARHTPSCSSCRRSPAAGRTPGIAACDRSAQTCVEVFSAARPESARAVVRIEPPKPRSSSASIAFARAWSTSLAAPCCHGTARRSQPARSNDKRRATCSSSVSAGPSIDRVQSLAQQLCGAGLVEHPLLGRQARLERKALQQAAAHAVDRADTRRNPSQSRVRRRPRAIRCARTRSRSSVAARLVKVVASTPPGRTRPAASSWRSSSVSAVGLAAAGTGADESDLSAHRSDSPNQPGGRRGCSGHRAAR